MSFACGNWNVAQFVDGEQWELITKSDKALALTISEKENVHAHSFWQFQDGETTYIVRKS